MIFDENDNIGAKPLAEIVEYLKSIDSNNKADSLMVSGSGQAFFGQVAPWRGQSAIFGYIGPGDERLLPILPLASIQADETLKGQTIKVTLDRLYIEEYPGSGEHRILFDFAGKNQIQGSAEELRFAAKCNARDGEASSINGLPIFSGLVVGNNGVSFQGRMVNVSSSDDDFILQVLDGDIFKQGLSLLHTAQPAIKPLTKLAEGIVTMAAKRSKNRQVHAFDLGLDFNGSPTSARLRCGSFVVVQISRTSNWNWEDFRWDTHSMSIQPVEGIEPLTLNYVVFGVSRYDSSGDLVKVITQAYI